MKKKKETERDILQEFKDFLNNWYDDAQNELDELNIKCCTIEKVLSELEDLNL